MTQLFKRSGVEWDNQWEKAPLPAAGYAPRHVGLPRSGGP